MLRYNRDRHRITVDPMSITLAPLLKIWAMDTTHDKDDAHKLLTYIHLVSQIDQDAPYAKVDPMEVSPLVRKELWGKYDYVIDFGDVNEEFMENTVLHYQSAYETGEEASVRSFDKKIYEIRNIIDTTTIKIETSVSRGTTTYVTNFTIINKMMQDVTKIVKARDELKALILKQNTRESIKGKQKLSFADKRRQELAKSRKPTIERTDTEDEPTDL